jgi:hypothetical protein
MKKAIFAAVALFAVAGVAQAKDVVTAKLEKPVAETVRVIASNSVWTCEGDTCRTVLQRAMTARACGQLAKEVGRVTSFGATDRALPEAEIAACNTRAPLAETSVAQR